MEYTPGIYEVISNVAIRREPRIVEYKDSKGTLVTNQVGRLAVGTKRAVYSVIVQKDNTSWGRVSFHDSAGIAEWACIKGLNREYMKFVEPLKDAPAEPNLQAQIDDLKIRIRRLEQIAGL